MALKVEDGKGVAGAESYATVAVIDTYWVNRAHSAFAVTWAAADAANKEGAAREATAYIDATYGLRFRGYRAGDIQGLEWPRSQASDDAMHPMTGLPNALVQATCEMAARALSESLAGDLADTGQVKRKVEKMGPMDETTDYSEVPDVTERFRFIERMLAPVMRHPQNWEFR